MNNNDERDYAEEAYNKAFMETGGETYPVPNLWYFSFGVSSQLISYNKELPVETDQIGFSLADKYVVVHAQDEVEAREKMIKYWGHNAWCGCYTQDKWIHTRMAATHVLLQEIL